MEPDVIKNYVSKIIKLSPKFILLRNLREGKQKKNKKKVGVTKQTKKLDYIRFFSKNYILIASNVIPFGFKTYDNFSSELLLFKRKN